MNRLPLIATVLAAACGCAATSLAAAAPYDSVYVFGDSLSDIGNVYAASSAPKYPGPPDYAAGRFSNGPVAVEVMTQLVTGAPLTLANDYAWGGARTGVSPFSGIDNNHAELNGHGLLAQTTTFHGDLKGGKADPNALYVVWAGANDFTEPQVAGNPAQWARVIGNVQTAIANLAADGATHFFVPNMPNLGLTPRAALAGQAAGASAASAGYNFYFAQGLTAYDAANPAIDIKLFDVYGFMTSIITKVKTDGSFMGFTDVTSQCQTTVGCVPSQAFFWDDEHPTARVHEVLGTAFAAAVPEPETYALMLGGLSIVGWAVRRQRRAVA